MKKILFVFVVFFIIGACQTQRNRHKSGRPYEVLSPEIYNKIQKEYSLISDFEEGTSIISDGYHYGLINENGKTVLECKYDTIHPVNKSYRIIKIFGKYGMVDIDGKLCISCSYDDFVESENKEYFAFKQNGKWGFLSNDEQIQLQFKYDCIENITDSTFVANLNGKYGLFKYNGDAIFEPKYDHIVYKWTGNESDPTYVYLNDKVAIVNSRNEFVTGFDYSGYGWFEVPQNGKYIEVFKVVQSKSNYNYEKKRYGIIEYETGREVIPCEYERLGRISEGLLCAEKNDKYGFIDLNNQVVIPFKFEDAEDFSEGLAMVAVHGGYYNSRIGVLPYSLYGYIDKKGQFVIPPKFPDPMSNSLYGGDGFHEGLAAMGERVGNYMTAQQFGYIDKTGKYIIPPIYDRAYPFSDNIAVVVKDEKFGCINRKGDVVVDIVYDDYVSRTDTSIVLARRAQHFPFYFDGTPVL